MLLEKVTHRSFESGKAEVVIGCAQQRARKIVSAGPAFGGETVNLWPAGVREANKFGHFVEALAGGVIEGRPEQLVLQFGADMDQQSVAAAHDERNVGLEAGKLRARWFACDPW